MADLPASLAALLEDERFPGYVFVGTDNGGETVTGISRVFHPDWIGWAAIVDPIKARLGLQHITAATHEQAAAINGELLKIRDQLLAAVGAFYGPFAWEPLGLAAEPTQIIADNVFNVAVWRGLTEGRACYADMKAGT